MQRTYPNCVLFYARSEYLSFIIHPSMYTMKHFLILWMLLTACTAVSGKNPDNAEVEKLKQTELDFSKRCAQNGMQEAFVFYADMAVIKPREGKFPIVGKDSLAAVFARKSRETYSLQWYPTRVEVSKSADLGYTFGNWILTTKEGEKSYGNYVTIWKKQKDGSWKYVLDTGNSTPEPPKQK